MAIEDLDAAADFSKAEDLVLLPTHGVAVTLVRAPTLRLLPGDMNGSVVPCSACHRDVTDVVEEEAPFFRFALCLEPAQPPAGDGFVVVDARLTHALCELTGTGFRSMDRWR